MAAIIVTDTAGNEHVVEGTPGLSVMKIIRENGVDDVIGLCGGNCACGTCHVLVDPAFGAKLEPIGEDESDVLDMTECRQGQSRLSCQIEFSAALDGLRVTIAGE
jgi:ferredoxin, 2Fe-2S